MYTTYPYPVCGSGSKLSCTIAAPGEQRFYACYSFSDTSRTGFTALPMITWKHIKRKMLPLVQKFFCQFLCQLFSHILYSFGTCVALCFCILLSIVLANAVHIQKASGVEATQDQDSTYSLHDINKTTHLAFRRHLRNRVHRNAHRTSNHSLISVQVHLAPSRGHLTIFSCGKPFLVYVSTTVHSRPPERVRNETRARYWHASGLHLMHLGPVKFLAK